MNTVLLVLVLIVLICIMVTGFEVGITSWTIRRFNEYRRKKDDGKKKAESLERELKAARESYEMEKEGFYDKTESFIRFLVMPNRAGILKFVKASAETEEKLKAKSALNTLAEMYKWTRNDEVADFVSALMKEIEEVASIQPEL